MSINCIKTNIVNFKVNFISLFNILFMFLLFFLNSVVRFPFTKPNQFLYAKILSSASTVATLSSQSRIVEIADRDTLFSAPKHPYTKALLNAVPEPDPEVGNLDSNQLIIGEVPSVRNPPTGCHFHPRCPQAMEICRTRIPKMTRVQGASLACHLYPE